MLPILPQTLEQIVHRINPDNTLLHAETLPGGASAQVILLHVKQRNHPEVQKYLLRTHNDINRWRNPKIAHHEFELLRTFYASGLPIAQPHILDESGGLYPHPYLVIDYLEGKTDFSPANLPDFLQQSAEALARIHRVERSSELNFLSNRAEHVLWWIQFQPEELDQAIDEGPLRELLRTLFPLNQTNDPTLLHGDFWLGNLLWQDGRLSGIIDWEDGEMGDPLSDLSISRLDILWAFGKDAMFDFTQLYQARMPHLDYANLPQWDLFSALRQANQLTDSAALYAAGGRPDITFETMQQAHHWFVKQATEQLNK